MRDQQLRLTKLIKKRIHSTMGGPMMLLKLLHCKRACQKSRHSEEKHSTSQDEGITESLKSEKQKEDMVCRVCLAKGDIPIFGSHNQDDLSDALNKFTDISVKVDDSYPKFLCSSCNALLRGAILLRKTAQKSDDILRTPELEEHIMNDPFEHTHADDEDQTFVDEESNVIENKDYHCKRCDLYFPTFTEYSDHRLSPEHESVRHKCPICHNLYTSLYFKKHLSLHKHDRPYMCDVCGKKFIIQGQCTRHRLTHFYNLPFKCELCPYRGRFSESLKMHMRFHTGEKPYQCTQCAHRFVNKSNLNKHLLTHKGEHNYVCSSCGRGFYTKRDLDLHFKVDHAGIKDHVCDICGKAFGYRKQMMKHQLKVHKRQKLRSGRMPLYLLVEKNLQKGVVAET